MSAGPKRWAAGWAAGALAGSPDEGGLPGGVLAHQQDHGLVVEISILQGGGVKLVEAVVLFQGQQFGPVEFLETLAHRLEDLGVLPAAVIGTQPAEHRGHRSPSRARCAVPAGGRGVRRPSFLGEGVLQGGSAGLPAAPPPHRSAGLSHTMAGAQGSGLPGKHSRSSPAPGTKPRPSFIQQPRPEGDQISGLGGRAAILGKKSNLLLKCQMPGSPVSPSSLPLWLGCSLGMLWLFSRPPARLRGGGGAAQPADSSASAAAARSPRRLF